MGRAPASCGGRPGLLAVQTTVLLIWVLVDGGLAALAFSRREV